MPYGPVHSAVKAITRGYLHDQRSVRAQSPSQAPQEIDVILDVLENVQENDGVEFRLPGFGRGIAAAEADAAIILPTLSGRRLYSASRSTATTELAWRAMRPVKLPIPQPISKTSPRIDGAMRSAIQQLKDRASRSSPNQNA